MSDVVSMVTWAVSQNAISLAILDGVPAAVKQHLFSIKEQAQAQVKSLPGRGGITSSNNNGAVAATSQPALNVSLKVRAPAFSCYCSDEANTLLLAVPSFV